MKKINPITECYLSNGLSPLIEFIDIKSLKIIEKKMRSLFSNMSSQEYDDQRGDVIKIHNPPPCITLYTDVKKILENIFQRRLYGSYWYSTLYYNNSFMTSHVDRTACEISVSMNLYQDQEWDLHILDYNQIDHAVKTPPGHGIIYDGINCPHWRERYIGKEYAQLFLHYYSKPPKILL